MGNRHITSKQAFAARKDYCEIEESTIEYLADKYDLDHGTMSKVIANKLFPDPTYIKPVKKGGGRKRGIYIPDHLKKMVHPTTAHRARGQNHTINRFK